MGRGRAVRLIGLAALVAIAPAMAFAGVLDIPGTYGNEAGCRYAKTQDYGDDSLLMLTPDEYMAYATGCEFLKALKAKDGSTILKMLCSHEGESIRSMDMIRVQPSPDVGNSYDLFGPDGGHLGIVGRCN